MATAPAPAAQNDPLARSFQRLGVTNPQDQLFIRALIQREAGGRISHPDGSIIYGQRIKSGMHKGDRAMGPLQVMPKTFAGIVKDSGLPLNSSSNDDLITAGVWYAMDNLRLAKGDYGKAAAAHLGGPGAMNKVRYDATSGDNTSRYAQGILDYMKAPPGTRSATAGAGAPRNPAPQTPQVPLTGMALLTGDGSYDALMQLTGGNTVAATEIAQRAGMVPSTLDELKKQTPAPRPASAPPSWVDSMWGDGGGASTNWISGAAQTAINELDRQKAVDFHQLKDEVNDAQNKRLAQAFGDTSYSETPLPGAVDRYVQGLLDS